MKLLTFYTESHKALANDFLLPSLKYFGEYEIVIGTGPQISNGEWDDKGFNLSVAQKIKFVLDSWITNEIFIFSDADVIFLKPTTEYITKSLDNFDIIFQDDCSDNNTGFYAYHCNQKVKTLLENSWKHCGDFHDDQRAINHFLKFSDIDYNIFDKSVWHYGFTGYQKIWNGDSPIPCPQETKIYHANWMVGVKRKEKALSMAREHFIIFGGKKPLWL